MVLFKTSGRIQKFTGGPLRRLFHGRRIIAAFFSFALFLNVSLWPAARAVAQTYDPTDMDKLIAVATDNIPNNVWTTYMVNWKSNPGDQGDWTGVTWQQGSNGFYRATEVNAHHSYLTGSVTFNGMDDLARLTLSGNYITELDVSPNRALTYLNVSANNLSMLDLSQNTALEYLDIGGNNLTALDLSQNTALTELRVGRNNLSTLDLSTNTALTDLSIFQNNLSELDLSANTALTYLFLDQSSLSELDLSANTALSRLSIHQSNLSELDLSVHTELYLLNFNDNDNLSTLDLSNNTNLRILNVRENNNLSELDISNSTDILLAQIANNNLSTIKLPVSTVFRTLNVRDNNLSELDVSANSGLITLNVANNNLSELDVSANSGLRNLNVANNNLSALDISANTALESLSVGGNKLPLTDLLDFSSRSYITNLEVGEQNDVSLDAISSVNGLTYDFSSQYFDGGLGHDTEFTVLSGDGGTAAEGVDYTINEGVISFMKRAAYKVLMEHEDIISYGTVDGVDYDALGNPHAKVTSEQFDVLPAGAAMTWNGQAGTVWSDGADNMNWLHNGMVTHFLDGDQATFGPGGGAVTVAAGGVNPGQVIVSGDGYVFSGGPISSGGLLLNAPASSVTEFANASAHFGAVTLGGGAGGHTLNLSGPGQYTADNLVVEGEGHTINASGSLAFKNVAFDLTGVGEGAVMLSAPNGLSLETVSIDKAAASGLANGDTIILVDKLTTLGSLDVQSRITSGDGQRFKLQWLDSALQAMLSNFYAEPAGDLFNQAGLNNKNIRQAAAYIDQLSAAPDFASSAEMTRINESFDAALALGEGGDPASAAAAWQQLSGAAGAYAAAPLNLADSQFKSILRGVNKVSQIRGEAAPAAGEGEAASANKFWVRTMGVKSEQESRENLAGYKYDSRGMAMGYSRDLGNIRLGVAAALSRGDMKIAQLQYKGEAEVLNLALSGVYNFDNGFYMAATVGYGRAKNDYDINMIIQGTKRGSYSGDITTAELEAGYAAELPNNWTLTPSVGLAYTRLKTKGWTEKVSGNPSLPANRFEGTSEDMLSVPVSVRVNKRIDLESGGAIIPEVELAYVWRPQSDRPQINASFPGAPGAMEMIGVDSGGSYWRIGGGLAGRISDTLGLNLNYTLETGHGFTGHNLSATLEITW